MALRFRYWNSSAESATVQTVFLTPNNYREALLRSFRFTSYIPVANDCLAIFRKDKEKEVQMTISCW
ncbi:uncharacterized protein Bfra_006861 [Botrytis fragariae]|uniref:Uncharacterized protein n=1 Tax=Botrytis fragariae TaxID=1964551 RepID=A0A8H6B582_9HELO|nr:uncharacterized protein Bfra_006861 [Botrytis fragariae]KAF5879654.1 hypothetical protein Bfra_006861 [Botrytis fragariae]